MVLKILSLPVVIGIVQLTPDRILHEVLYIPIFHINLISFSALWIHYPYAITCLQDHWDVHLKGGC